MTFTNVFIPSTNAPIDKPLISGTTATSRFNHKVKSKKLATSDFSLNMNADLISNKECPHSPKFNSFSIKKKSDRYYLVVDVSEFEFRSIKIDANEEESTIILQASQIRKINEKYAEVNTIKHSYRLSDADTTKLTSILKPDGKLLIKMPIKKVNSNLATTNQLGTYPKTNQDKKSIVYHLTLPQQLNTSTLSITNDGRKVLVNGERGLQDESEKHKSFCYFHSVTFPANTNFSTLKYHVIDNVLILNAKLF